MTPPAPRRAARRRLHRLAAAMLLACLVTGVCAAPLPTSRQLSCATITVYTAAGCPHCAAAAEYLEQMSAREARLSVTAIDVSRDRRAYAEFVAFNHEHGVERPGVPTFSICGEIVVGFDRVALEERLYAGSVTPGSVAPTLPFIGAIDPDALGLPIFTVAVGLLDGFNPCAMWVLVFVLSVLVNVRNRARILVIAGTFVLVSGLVYFAFMAAWLNAFFVVGYSRVLQVVVGAAAMLVGSVHIKDFFALHRGISLSIPESAKPGLYARIRRVVRAENLPAAAASAVVLAVLVNLVELLCTAGLPALYTQVLAQHSLSPAQYYAYLALYNLAYVADDAVMVALAVITLGRRRMQERQGRWLKLLSGVVIGVLGILLILAPDRLAFRA